MESSAHSSLSSGIEVFHESAMRMKSQSTEKQIPN